MPVATEGAVPGPACYRRRRPEHTLLYHIVQTHFETWFEGGITPIVKPSVLGQMGYGIALYGITLLLRITKAMQLALADLKSDELKLVGTGTPFEEYTKIVGAERWRKIEQEFGQS